MTLPKRVSAGEEERHEAHEHADGRQHAAPPASAPDDCEVVRPGLVQRDVLDFVHFQSWMGLLGCDG
jgi:hypothetical protein